MSGYFRLRDDMRIPGRWMLGSPTDVQGHEVDPWQFSNGRPLDVQGKIRFQVEVAGQSLDFSLDTLAIPVVNGRVVALFEKLGIQEVQFIPVEVEGQREPWFILNTLRSIRCIDDAQCEEVKYWKPEDGQPEKVGEYRVVSGMRIDPAKVGDARIFRPWGWEVALVVSEELKEAMTREGITGTKFVPV